MNTLIHIGFPKTGTTWLQTSVFCKMKNIKLITPDKEILVKLINTEIKTQELKKQYFTNYKNLLYSDPELSGLIAFNWNNGKNKDIILSRLYELFPDAKILITIRNQPDFLASGYAYYIKKGGTYKFKNYFEKIKNHQSGFSLDYLKYDNIISAYSEKFGENNIKIIPYEKLLDNKQKVIEEIAGIYKWELTGDIDFSKKNQRLRKRLLHALRLLNYFSKNEIPEKNYILDCPFVYKYINQKYEYFNFYKIFGNYINVDNLISAEIKEFIDKYYQDSNKQLCKYIDKTLLEKYSYPL